MSDTIEWHPIGGTQEQQAQAAPKSEFDAGKVSVSKTLAKPLGVPPMMVWKNIDATDKALYGQGPKKGSLADRVKGSIDEFNVQNERSQIGAKRLFGTATAADIQRDDELKKQQSKPEARLGHIPDMVFQTVGGLGYMGLAAAGTLSDWGAAAVSGELVDRWLGGKPVTHFTQMAQAEQQKFLGTMGAGLYTHMRDEGHSVAVSRAVALPVMALQAALFGLPVSKIPGVSKLLGDSVAETVARVTVDGSLDKVVPAKVASGVAAKAFAGRAAQIEAFNLSSSTLNAMAPILANTIEKNAQTQKIPKQTVAEVLGQIFGPATAATAVMSLLGLPSVFREGSALQTALENTVRDHAEAPPHEGVPEAPPITESVQAPKPSEPSALERATSEELAARTSGQTINEAPALPGEPHIALTEEQAAKLDEATRSEEGTSNYINEQPSIKAIVTQIQDKRSQIAALGDRESGLKAHYQQQLSALEEQHAEAAKSLRLQIQGRAETNKMIRDIASVQRQLPTMKTGQATIEEHEQFLAPLRHLLNEFNTKKPMAVTLQKLGDIRKGLESENTNVKVPQSMLDRLSELDKTSLRDLSTEDLKTVHDAVMAYATEAKQRAQIVIQGKSLDYQVALRNIMASIRKPKLSEEELAKPENAAQRTVGRTFEAIKDLAVVSELQYDTMVNHLFGGEESPGYDVFGRQWDDGSRVKSEFSRSIHDAENRWYDANGGDNFLYDRVDVPGGLKDGSSVTMTKGHLLSAWMHRQWPQNWDSFSNGIAMPGFLRGRETILPVNHEAFDKAFESSFSATDKKFLSTISSLIKQQITPKMQQKFLEQNGYFDAKAWPEFYWPLNHVRRAISDTAASSDIVRRQISRSSLFMGIDKGHVKERVDSKAPIYLRPIQDELSAMIDFASHYIGLSDVAGKTARLLRDSGLRYSIEQAHGPAYIQALVNGANAMSGVKYTPDMFERSALSLRNTGISAAMMFNPSPVIRNLFLATRSQQYVPYGDWLAGVATGILHAGKTHKLLDTASIYYHDAATRGSSAGVRATMEAAQQRGILRKVQRVGMAPEMWSIAQTYRMEMAGAMHYALRAFKEGIDDPSINRATGKTAAEHSALSAEDRVTAAVRFAEYVMKRTHASGEPQYQSNLVLTGKPIPLLVSTLGSEGNAALNMIIRAGIDAPHIKGGWKRVGKMVVALGVLAPLADWATRQGIEAIQHKPEKKKTTLGEAAMVTGAETVYGASNIAYAMEQVLKGGQTPTVSSMTGQRVNDILSAFADFHRAQTDKTAKGRQDSKNRGIETMIGAIASIAGVPFWTARSYLLGAEAWMKGSAPQTDRGAGGRAP